MQYFFKIPFANIGDKQNIPTTPQADGQVSFPIGWGPDYQKDLKTEASAKAVERGVMNNILNLLTQAMQELQGDSFPGFITSAQNGGTPYIYSKGNGVSVNGTHYVSLTNNNTSIPGQPGASWQEFAFEIASQTDVDNGTGNLLIVTPPTLKANLDARFNDISKQLAPFLLPVGCIISWPTSVPPSGWIECNGQGFDQAKNPLLTAVLPGGSVPDLRGRFIRGWAHGSTVDPEPGRGVLSEQAPANMTHYHHTGRLWAPAGNNDDIWLMDRGNDNSGEAYPAFVITGDSGNSRLGAYPATGSGQFSATTNPRRLDGTPGTPDPYPGNTALMYIIKTDQADNIAPEPTPNNIIVTPSVLTIGVGRTQQFTAQVLPANLAGQFPVTWLSTNTAAGTIDANGLYTSRGNGATDIIASISTGLSVRVNVQNYVLLTALALAPIPDQLAGTTYQLQVTRTPANATEPVTFESTNNAVATAGSDGVLVNATEGTATITVRGSIGGIQANRPVNVAANPIVEKYLQISKNLSEIEGDVNKAAARANLGLGALATKDSLNAVEVLAVPMANAALPAGTNLNNITSWGEYFQDVQSNVTLALNYPVANTPVTLKVYRRNIQNSVVIQEVRTATTPVQLWLRQSVGSPAVFGPWAQVTGGTVGGGTVTLLQSGSLQPGGTGVAPSIPNPFPGHNASVIVEINPLGNQFGIAGWGSDENGIYGTRASRLKIESGTNAGDWIAVVVARDGVTNKSEITGTPLGVSGPVPLVGGNAWRVIVTDLGPDA